jgi:predicted RNA-binding Zn-ribbon protein involved in translation (DUF1610 family)
LNQLDRADHVSSSITTTPEDAAMAEKVKSYYCEVCGRQSKFTKSKTGGKTTRGMFSRAYKDSNPLMAATGMMTGAAGAAVTAAKSYRCVNCGSKKGAKPRA